MGCCCSARQCSRWPWESSSSSFDEKPAALLTPGGEDTRAVGFADAFRLIRESPSLGQITLLVSFAAFGAILLDQQLNMAAEQFRGGNQNAITSFLASVRFLLSASALLIQVVLVKQIYRFLGVGVALLILPVTLGITSALILVSGALWAAAVASVVDRSIRYTVDRNNTRDLFLASSVSAAATCEVVRGCHSRPTGTRVGCGAPPGTHQAVGCGARVAPAQSRDIDVGSGVVS